MADKTETANAILEEIDMLLSKGVSDPGSRAAAVLRLAEAYAWILYPNNAHAPKS